MKLKFGFSSILGISGLTAAIAALPTHANVDQKIIDALAAARLSPVAKHVVQDLPALAALAAKPGDIVTVVAGGSGAREVREVTAVDADGLVTDSTIIERERSVEVPVTESVLVGEDGALALQYEPAHGLGSIANFGNVLFTNVDTGESAMYSVSQVEGGYTVDAELAGAAVKIQYSRLVTLAVSDAGGASVAA